MRFYRPRLALLSDALKEIMDRYQNSGRVFASKIDDLYIKGFIDGAIEQKKELGFDVVEDKIHWSTSKVQNDLKINNGRID